MNDLRKLGENEIKQWLSERNYPAFRGRQLDEWLWKRNAGSFDAMQNLPAALREQLSASFFLESVGISEFQESTDGSVKYALRLSDGAVVEMVLIPSRNRSTLCVSSQVGCPLNCRFCATARLGFQRNLSAYEMYAQVYKAQQESMARYGHPLSNIVWMGMGEPLLNYDSLKSALQRVVSENGLGMSPSRITVSTSGICDGIRRLAADGIPVHLAVSLHTADKDQRSELMPVSRKYPLPELSDALYDYYQQTGRRITVEYMLLQNVNDSPRHAELLLKFCRRFPVKINLIEYNQHPYAPYRASEAAVFSDFVKALEDRNLIVNVRRSKGRDIAAACGQLANARKKKQ